MGRYEMSLGVDLLFLVHNHDFFFSLFNSHCHPVRHVHGDTLRRNQKCWIVSSSMAWVYMLCLCVSEFDSTIVSWFCFVHMCKCSLFSLLSSRDATTTSYSTRGKLFLSNGWSRISMRNEWYIAIVCVGVCSRNLCTDYMNWSRHCEADPLLWMQRLLRIVRLRNSFKIQTNHYANAGSETRDQQGTRISVP